MVGSFLVLIHIRVHSKKNSFVVFFSLLLCCVCVGPVASPRAHILLTHTHTHTHIHTHTHTHPHISIHTHASTHCAEIHTHIHTHTYTPHIYAHTHRLILTHIFRSHITTTTITHHTSLPHPIHHTSHTIHRTTHNTTHMDDDSFEEQRGRTALYQLVEREADPPGETLIQPLYTFAEQLDQEDDEVWEWGGV